MCAFCPIRLLFRRSILALCIALYFATALCAENELLYLDLESSLGIAINNNIELKAIHASKQIYDLTVTERLRDYFPTLALSYMNTQEVAIRETDSRRRKLSMEANFNVYDGGKRGLAYDISKLKSILARNDYRIARNRLIAETIQAYLELIQLKGVIDIHKKTLERGMMQLTLIKKEHDLGEATTFNVLEIEAKVMEIELNLKKATDNFEIALNRFKVMLKLDWRQPVEILGDVKSDFILFPIDTSFTVNDFVAIATKNRKEIESGEVEFSINSKTYYMNKLYYFPQFSVGVNYSLSDTSQETDRFMPREKGWGINFQATTALWGSTTAGSMGYSESGNSNSRNRTANGTVNVLDSMDYKRKIVESKIQMDTARDTRVSNRHQIAIEVVSSYMALENSWDMIEIAQKQLELYDTQLEIERLKANMGESKRYDLMKKEIERGEAAIACLESRVRYLTNASILELAMGVDIGFLKLSNYRGTIHNENYRED